MMQNVILHNNNMTIIPAKKEYLLDTIEYVENKLFILGCPYRLIVNFRVAVDELITNIINYGADNETTLFVQIDVYFNNQKGSYHIKISDKGKAFNLLKVSKTDEKFKAGGLGIFIVRKLMDEVKYSYVNGMNIVELIQFC